MSMKKIAMFGGSFNPPHLGHFQLAETVIQELELDALLLIPVFIPPHKAGDYMVSPEHRLAMCRIFERYDPRIKTSDIEISRGGSSYTVDTLCRLKDIYPDSKLYLIVGADMYMTLQSWKDPEKICELATVCTVSRNADDVEMLTNHSRFLRRFNCESVIIPDSVIPVSSTQVRNSVKSGKQIDSLVLPEVWEYIRTHGLYI